MRTILRSLSVRAKLTLWYLGVLSTALLLFGLLSLGALRYALLQVKRATLNHREQRLMLFLEQNQKKQTPTALAEQLHSYALIAHEGNLFQIRDLDGSLLFPLDAASADWLAPAALGCSKRSFGDRAVDGQTVTVMCHVTVLNGHPVRLYIGSSLEEESFILSSYRKALLILWPCLLGIAAVGGDVLSRRALRPVDRMTKAALGIGIGNLSSRLPLPSARDELWSLANAWNQLLDRLQGAVTRLSEFSADASHDLRTSITVILATAQLSLQRHRSEHEYRDDLDRIVGECRTASTLLDALLSLARSDNFVHEAAFQRINVTELVLAGCRRVEDLAESSGIVLDWRLPPTESFIQGDELLLQRLLGILLDNAIKYTPEHGEILVEVSSTVSQVVLTVRDTGIGMTEDVRQHIFDRFYQADLRERKHQAGSGLGLSIARWIAEAHRAELAVESTPTHGSTFQIRFPVITAVAAAALTRADHAMTLQ
jgi:two-component system, OmpR family, heavy metal sensor histidine kinase CusS